MSEQPARAWRRASLRARAHRDRFDLDTRNEVHPGCRRSRYQFYQDRLSGRRTIQRVGASPCVVPVYRSGVAAPAGHRRAPYSSTMDSRNTGDEQQRASEPDNISGATGEAPFGGDDRGDGVVIPADFGAGSSGRGGDRFPSVEPDLSSSVDDVVFEDSVIELTARQRRFVEVAAWTLADDVYDAIEELHRRPGSASHSSSILSDFPPVTWTRPAAWWREQARCFDDLALEAQAGIDPDPVCTGEEMALHLILGRARAMATDESDRRMDLVGDIAAHDNDNDWEGPLDYLFQDHDVLTLFDNDLEPFPGAVNLVPAEWFTPFVDIESRRPDRGFRR